MTVLFALFGIVLAIVIFVATTSDDLEPPSSPNSPARLAFAGAR